jgi:cytochrome c oxidase cbb3-type subunit III
MSAEENKPIHEYDGIEECDNALPRWWLGIFFGTLAFGVVYFLAAEFRVTPTPRDAYREEMAKAAAQQVNVDEPTLVSLASDPKMVEEGKQVFNSTCAPCHAANAGGGIGPNLTDEYWLHGGKPTAVYATIKDGFVQKGMPAWGGSLGEDRVRMVSAYVLSLKNTKVSGGKAPQGEPEL